MTTIYLGGLELEDLDDQCSSFAHPDERLSGHQLVCMISFPSVLHCTCILLCGYGYCDLGVTLACDMEYYGSIGICYAVYIQEQWGGCKSEGESNSLVSYLNKGNTDLADVG